MIFRIFYGTVALLFFSIALLIWFLALLVWFVIFSPANFKELAGNWYDGAIEAAEVVTCSYLHGLGCTL